MKKLVMFACLVLFLSFLFGSFFVSAEAGISEECELTLKNIQGVEIKVGKECYATRRCEDMCGTFLEKDCIGSENLDCIWDEKCMSKTRKGVWNPPDDVFCKEDKKPVNSEGNKRIFGYDKPLIEKEGCKCAECYVDVDGHVSPYSQPSCENLDGTELKGVCEGAKKPCKEMLTEKKVTPELPPEELLPSPPIKQSFFSRITNFFKNLFRRGVSLNPSSFSISYSGSWGECGNKEYEKAAKEKSKKYEPGREITCDDGADNDCDGKTDKEDEKDCPTEKPIEKECTNNEDCADACKWDEEGKQYYVINSDCDKKTKTCREKTKRENCGPKITGWFNRGRQKVCCYEESRPPDTGGFGIPLQIITSENKLECSFPEGRKCIESLQIIASS